MNNDRCRQIDAYLLGDLDEPQAEAFELHALECDLCRAELSAHERVDSALESQRDVTAPGALRMSIAAEADRLVKRRRGRRSAASAAAAAAVLLAVFLSTARERPEHKIPPPVATPRQPREAPPTTNSDAEEAPAATVDFRGMIAMPIESPSPEVTVVMLHPTLSTQRRMQFAAAMSPDVDANGDN